MKRSIDVTVVKKLQKGDMEAFDDIYNWYKDALYYFVFSIAKNKVDAEEIVQETFINVIRKINTLKKPESFHSWIFTIAHNNLRLYYRNNKREVVADEDFNLEEVVFSEESQIQEIESKEVYSIVMEELHTMSPRYIQVGMLRYFEDLPVSEISDILKVPEGTVKTRLFKIRSELQKRLHDRGYSPSKYFSVGGIPLLAYGFSEAIKQGAMNSVASVHVYEAIISSTSTITSSVASTTSSLLSNITRAATVVGIAATAGFIIYSQTDTVSAQIEEIAYNKQLTNENVEVSVKISDLRKSNNISITYDNKKIGNYTVDGDSLVFIAKENGDYVVTVNDDSKAFSITNIDKQAPRINGITQDEQGFVVDTNNIDDLDYSKSGMIIANEKFNLQDNGRVTLPSDWTNGVLELHDKVGNVISYEITKK